jgi:ADP-ribosylglycohydrolase
VTADAAVGALLGTFAGDAIGRPWEGSSPASGRSARDRLTWLDGERVLTYTDDTQLAG